MKTYSSRRGRALVMTSRWQTIRIRALRPTFWARSWPSWIRIRASAQQEAVQHRRIRHARFEHGALIFLGGHRPPAGNCAQWLSLRQPPRCHDRVAVHRALAASEATPDSAVLHAPYKSALGPTQQPDPPCSVGFMASTVERTPP